MKKNGLFTHSPTRHILCSLDKTIADAYVKTL